MQLFVDDSGGSEHAHIVLAGFIAPSVIWADFSQAWRAILDETPGVRFFKMDDAVGRNRSWHRLSATQRDEKLGKLAKLISGSGLTSIHCTTSLEDFRRSPYAGMPKPVCDPVFVPFQIVMIGAAYELLERGQKRGFEIFFDDTDRLKDKIRRLFAFIRTIAPPDVQQVLPVEPLFRSDEKEMPLQAADMLAWFFRRTAPGSGPTDFDWLIPMLATVPVSHYSSTLVGDRWRAFFEDSFTPSAVDKISASYDRLFGVE